MVFAVAALAASNANAQAFDFGERVQKLLENNAQLRFGFGKPLEEPVSVGVPRAVGQPASDRQELAHGLQASFVARNVAVLGDMISFWPNDVARGSSTSRRTP